MSDSAVLMSKEELRQAYEDLLKKCKEIVQLHEPTDMTVDKVFHRATVIAANIGQTRTSVMGAAVFAAITAPVVGLTRETMINIINGVYDESEKNPAIKQLAEEYT